MSLTREEVLAEIDRMMDEGRPQPNDVFISDLIERGMSDTTARRYLDSMVKNGTMRKVSLFIDGRRVNAFRPL